MPTWSKQAINIPNAITFARLPLVAWCAWEASQGRSQLAFGVFIFVWLLDGADGIVARLLRQTTDFGYFFDKVVDRLVLPFGVIVLMRYGVLPPITIFLFVRDIGYIPALYPVRDLRRNWHGAGFKGKLVTALQGIGVIWLYYGWSHPLFIVVPVALLGALVAARHLRSLVMIMLFIAGSASAQGSEVVINEVMWDGSEYIELYNGGNEAASLAGWRLTRQQPGGEEKTIIVFNNETVQNSTYFLIERSENATTIPADVIASGLVLVQDGEIVRLYDGEGVLIDSVDGSGGWPAGKNTAEGISMERSGGSWDTSSGSGGGRFGTPRTHNSDAAADSSPVAESPKSESQVTTYNTSVVINEFLPNPVGDDVAGEFIELFNPSGSSANLSGWQLDDALAGSKSYTLPDNVVIGAQSYWVFRREETGIALNNTGDEVRLLDPNGKVHAQVAYDGSVPEGQSYNATSGGYAWSTTSTRGAANVIVEPEAAPAKDRKNNSSIKQSPAAATAHSNISYSTTVVVFRALPNPVGPDDVGEFIELKNTGKNREDLSGWQLDDAEGGSAPYVIPDGVSIAAGATLQFSREDTGIALNNSNDAARLLAPDGTVISTLAYESVREGQVVQVGEDSPGLVNASKAPASEGRVAGTEDTREVDATAVGASDTSGNSGPIALAGITGGGVSGGGEGDAPTEISESKFAGIVVGLGLALAAGIVGALSFVSPQTLAQWKKYLVSWRGNE